MRIFAVGENSLNLRLKSKLFDLRLAKPNRIPRGARIRSKSVIEAQKKTIIPYGIIADIRRWRKFAQPAPEEQALRSTVGETEPDSAQCADPIRIGDRSTKKDDNPVWDYASRIFE